MTRQATQVELDRLPGQHDVQRSSTGVSSNLPSRRPGAGSGQRRGAQLTHRADLSPAVNHVGMRVEDMDAAIAWYRAVLGFDLIDGPV
jgi:Glyoxalase/Bleomycin resistance protein/Dioxygenase superfamily